MNKISTIILFSIILSITLISPRQAAWGCQVDDFYLTKGGSLAAASPERLQEAGAYEKENNKEKLDDLLKNKQVMRLEDNRRVRALERSFAMKMIKIKFEDDGDVYWVNDGALRQIRCDEK
jgi:hypothetical protein